MLYNKLSGFDILNTLVPSKYEFIKKTMSTICMAVMIRLVVKNSITCGVFQGFWGHFYSFFI